MRLNCFHSSKRQEYLESDYSIVFKVAKRLASSVCSMYSAYAKTRRKLEKRPRRYIHQKTVRKNFDLPAISATRFRSWNAS